jgi:hypothetical protein
MIAGVFPPTSSTFAGFSQRSIMPRTFRFGSLALASLLASCVSYVTPGRGADMKLFKPSNAMEQDIAKALERKPLAQFPAAVAVVRVQAPNYTSNSVRNTSGGGNYTVLTMRDIDTEADFARMNALSQVRGIGAVNRLLVPDDLRGADDLRKIAAELHADMLLVYTLDTVFKSSEHAAPLALVSLGLLPTKVASVDTTASAIVLDTRTGYLYGTAEATVSNQPMTNAWSSQSAVDASRKMTERAAFEKLLGEFEHTWTGVVAQYAGPQARAGSASSSQ